MLSSSTYIHTSNMLVFHMSVSEIDVGRVPQQCMLTSSWWVPFISELVYFKEQMYFSGLTIYPCSRCLLSKVCLIHLLNFALYCKSLRLFCLSKCQILSKLLGGMTWWPAPNDLNTTLVIEINTEHKRKHIRHLICFSPAF